MPSAVSSRPPRLSREEKERAYLLAAERLRRRAPDLLAWSAAHRLEQGRPLDFDRFPYQRELYVAFGDRGIPSVDVMKSAQCGVSALGVSLALYAGDVWGANVLYVLPAGDDAYDFSDTRVRPAIEDSPYLASRVQATDNKGLKRVGEAFCYFRGSVSERKALSIPADVLILDEYDRLDQRNIPKFRRRLGSPLSLRLERRFSNPSYPEFGIHALYLASDQREWLVRCPACRHEAELAYDEGDGCHHVDPERAVRVCGRCRRSLSPEAVAAGRWVARRPDVAGRGYHISKLIVPGADVAELVREHGRTAEDEVQTHYNFDLGLPYAPRGGSLSEAAVLACRRDWRMPDRYDGPGWVTAGVDVGRVLHVRISTWLPSGKAVPLHLGTVDSFEELGGLWRRYGVNLGLIDERPEERKAREFAEAHRGRAYLVRWSGPEQRDPVVVDEDKLLVVARRTAAYDRVVAAFEEQRRLLPRDLPEGYVRQVTAPHRVTETDARGGKVARYVSERADHFFSAECYDLLAREVRGGPPAEAAGPAPETVLERARRSRWR